MRNCMEFPWDSKTDKINCFAFLKPFVCQGEHIELQYYIYIGELMSGVAVSKETNNRHFQQI